MRGPKVIIRVTSKTLVSSSVGLWYILSYQNMISPLKTDGITNI